MASAAPLTNHIETMQRNAPQQMIVDDDPLLIAQTLTYVTDDGSVVLNYSGAPFSWCKSLAANAISKKSHSGSHQNFQPSNFGSYF